MPPDGSPSQAPVPFPATLWSEVLAVRDPGAPEYRQRMNRLIERYWRPVFWSLRLRWKRPPEEAADLAQDFFMKVLDGKVVTTVDPARGSFRHYLRQGLDFFMNDAAKASYALKRGGGRAALPLDFGDGSVPAELADDSGDPAGLFDRAWAHQVLGTAVEELLAELPRREAEIFQALDLGDPATRPSLRDMAARMGVSKSEVWKLLAEARRRLRDRLMERVKEYVADERELFRELDELFSA